jgi:haloacetate dehalogenase
VWSGIGPVGSSYVDDGGPLEIWRELTADATGEPVDGGHFFPEEHPRETAYALAAFFSSGYH